MLTLITGAEVYAPEYIGKRDILVLNDRIEKISREIKVGDYQKLGLDMTIINGSGKMLTPGFIDSHVHLIGGGGEGGYHTRTPEVDIKDIVGAGTTTVVGLLGTDKTSRHLESLYAKAKALDTEGITAYMYTGNYHVPTPTVTGDIQKDIYMLDKVIGTGEIAISDHRSGQPGVHELAKTAADTRIGGLTSGKAGVTHFHTGGGPGLLTPLHRLLDDHDIPADKIYPTHINRTEALIDDAAKLSRRGCYVDMTVGEDIVEDVLYYRQSGGDMARLTLSSDGNGSLPVFDASGQMTGMTVARPGVLLEGVQKLIRSSAFDAADVLKLVTEHTAAVLNFGQKGKIEEGRDADILLFDEDMALDTVLAKGRVLQREGVTVARSTFDK